MDRVTERRTYAFSNRLFSLFHRLGMPIGRGDLPIGVQMKFKIERASDWRQTKPPTPKATQIGVSVSDMPLWEIEINSLEELLELVVLERSIILNQDKDSKEFEVVIYDDYIE